MPNLLRKSRPADTVEKDGPNSSTKQRLIDATKMILDIVNECAVICPPLKACLGGISALMKLCEDSKDVEEKLGDLITWVLKLKENVPAASADDDPEGAMRDEQLIRELNEIGRQSEALAKKGVEARLADHKQDSGKVVKLVERLRQALVMYQFLQQQAMYNQVKNFPSKLFRNRGSRRWR
ncbi:hypothetical protein BJ322DRAFT_339349 [Thelephora terrestris]|uniref:Uncharacterized protein n=1 Tax=Thelephora terrestris TaxID=56493 RepID=A0A9P6H6Y7_9AGAM|nr:hypothetical protein BJ322DRAFT_339349 [Thelephora terrestris]